MQNMEGLVSDKSIEKVKLLNEYTQIDNIILMNLTETWLDNTVEDVVEIEMEKLEVVQQYTYTTK